MKNSSRKYFSDLCTSLSKIEVRRENLDSIDLDEALEEILQRISKTKVTGGKVIFIGNGGSAAIASHQAVDFWKNGGIRAVSFNDTSLLTCISNDYGYEHVFEKPIEMFAESSDVLIAISSSGKSRNILRGVEIARSKNCFVITLSGFKPDNPLRRKGRLNFYVPSESYGFVEISHLTICHYLADRLCAQNQPHSSAVRKMGTVLAGTGLTPPLKSKPVPARTVPGTKR